MSMWTGASDELTKYLAQRDVERQQELVNNTALQERDYRRQRDVVGDERAKQQDALAALRQKQLDEDRDAAREENIRNHEFQQAQLLRQTMEAGEMTKEEYDFLVKHKMAQGVAKKTAAPVLKIGAPIARPGQAAGEPWGETTIASSMPDVYESLGGTEVQAKQREIAARAEAAHDAQLERAIEAQKTRDLQKYIADQASADRQTSAAATRAIAEMARTGMTTNQTFNNSMQLAKMYDSGTKGLREVKRQLGMMDEGLKALTVEGGKSSGGQTIINTFNKILDPLSVVRESEYLRSVVGQSLVDQLDAAISKAMVGGAGVSDAELKNIVNLARTFAQRYESSMAGYTNRIKQSAAKYHLDDPTINFDASDAAAAGAAPAAAPKPGDLLGANWGDQQPGGKK